MIYEPFQDIATWNLKNVQNWIGANTYNLLLWNIWALRWDAGINNLIFFLFTFENVEFGSNRTKTVGVTGLFMKNERKPFILWCYRNISSIVLKQELNLTRTWKMWLSYIKPFGWKCVRVMWCPVTHVQLLPTIIKIRIDHIILIVFTCHVLEHPIA